jgi:colicin import membrane protein
MKHFLYLLLSCVLHWAGNAFAQSAAPLDATAASPDLLQGLDLEAERKRIRSEREKSDATYSATLKLCYQKFAVNGCKQDALDEKIKRDNDLRRQETILNNAVRKQRGDKALLRLEDKQSQEKQLKDEEQRMEQRNVHLDKLQENLEKNEKHLDKQLESEASREKYQQRLQELQERQRKHEEKAAQAAQKRAQVLRKQEEADKHRKNVEKEAAERNPNVQALPIPKPADIPQ